MKLNLILKILPIEIILALEIKTNENLMKELCFKFLSRNLIYNLTLRGRKRRSTFLSYRLVSPKIREPPVDIRNWKKVYPTVY